MFYFVISTPFSLLFFSVFDLYVDINFSFFFKIQSYLICTIKNLIRKKEWYYLKINNKILDEKFEL